MPGGAHEDWKGRPPTKVKYKIRQKKIYRFSVFVVVANSLALLVFVLYYTSIIGRYILFYMILILETYFKI